jgi:hypothetical protein
MKFTTLQFDLFYSLYLSSSFFFLLFFYSPGKQAKWKQEEEKW